MCSRMAKGTMMCPRLLRPSMKVGAIGVGQEMYSVPFPPIESILL